MKKQKGITLIVLVITILVILILAGVSISIISGDSGIFKRAQEAVKKTEEAEPKEIEDIDNMANYVDRYASEKVTTQEDTRLVSQITAANYGDSINYSANGVTDWKIFYNDGENVFIITSDYLNNSNLPSNAKLNTYEGYPYSAYWASDGKIIADVTGSADIDTNIANKYRLSWLHSYPTSTNNNIKSVATLLDTEVWNAFAVSTYADSAIGSPTLEMFAESWNNKYSAEEHAKIYYDCTNDLGYYVTTTAPSDRTEEVTTAFISMSGEAGYSDTLYFPHTDVYESSEFYWLASPSALLIEQGAFTGNTPNCVGYSGMVGATSEGCCGSGTAADLETAGVQFSIRPVVCLNTNAKASKVDGVWNFE